MWKLLLFSDEKQKRRIFVRAQERQIGFSAESFSAAKMKNGGISCFCFSFAFCVLLAGRNQFRI